MHSSNQLDFIGVELLHGTYVLVDLLASRREKRRFGFGIFLPVRSDWVVFTNSPAVNGNIIL
jgi:hypothetical protein